MKRWIKIIFPFLVVFPAYCKLRQLNQQLERKSREKEKLDQYVELLTQWNENMLLKKDLALLLEKNHIQTLSIYGYGKLGKLLFQNVKDHIQTLSFIDKKIASDFISEEQVPVLSLASAANMVQKPDMVVITPIYDFDKIYLDLARRNIAKQVVGLDDLVYENCFTENRG